MWGVALGMVAFTLTLRKLTGMSSPAPALQFTQSKP
jgi:hypothetical protein